jgi:hypothetical protein
LHTSHHTAALLDRSPTLELSEGSGEAGVKALTCLNRISRQGEVVFITGSGLTALGEGGGKGMGVPWDIKQKALYTKPS